MAIFFDTHAHLDGPDFASDLPEVVTRATAAGIVKIVTIGTDLASSQRAVEIAEHYPNIFAAVGWHPSHADEAPEDIRPALRKLAQHPKVVALGETGLDYYRLPSKMKGASAAEDERYKARQVQLFEQHLQVGAELGLGCVIHQRDSLEDTIHQLAPYAGRVRGVFHCFSDDASTMRRILGLGSLVSFTGIVSFKKADTIRATVAETPLDSLMLETDSPYLAPVPYRGKRCEPAYVKEVAAMVAEVKGCSTEDLSQATCATAEKFFHKMRGG